MLEFRKISVGIVSAAALLSLVGACGAETAVQTESENSVPDSEVAEIQLVTPVAVVKIAPMEETTAIELQIEKTNVKMVDGQPMQETMTQIILSDDELKQLDYPNHWPHDLVRQVHKEFAGIYEGVDFSVEPPLNEIFNALAYEYERIVGGLSSGGACLDAVGRIGYIERAGERPYFVTSPCEYAIPRDIVGYLDGVAEQNESGVIPFENVMWLKPDILPTWYSDYLDGAKDLDWPEGGFNFFDYYGYIIEKIPPEGIEWFGHANDYRLFADVIGHNYRVGKNSPLCNVIRSDGVVAPEPLSSLCSE